jgi:archaellin
LSPFTPTIAAAPPQSTPAATTKKKTTTPTTTTQTTRSKMKTSVVAINLENPEDNDHFYAWPESAIELEEGTKQIDLVAISVAITDIDDFTENRYDVVVSASKREVIVKMPKQPKHHYNSAARTETSYNIRGHQIGANKMKEHILNLRDESVCKKSISNFLMRSPTIISMIT